MRSLIDTRVLGIRLAIVAVIFLSASTAAATLLPWSGTADAYDHLDYVVQVHNGELPAAVGHDWKPEGHPGSGRSDESRQFASAHPPLFYAIGAAVAGDLLTSEQWRAGVLAMRLVTMIFGLVGLVGLAWIGWGIGGRHRERWAVALPLVGGLVFPYLRFSTEPYNDVPLAAASTVAIALCINLVRFGPRWWSVAALCALAVVGVGMKSTFVLTLAGICVTLAVVVYRHSRGRALRRAGLAAAVSALPALASALAWGWFYLLNVERSGYWYRSTPKAAVGNRSDKTLTDNLTNPEFYLIAFDGLIGRGSTVTASVNSTLALAVAGLLAAFSLLALIRARTTPGRLRSPLILLIGAALALHLCGSYVLQLSHATGFGAYNARYFLPSIATIVAIVVAGLLSSRWWLVAVAVVASFFLVANLLAMLAYGAARRGEEFTPAGAVAEAAAQASANGVPADVPAVAIALAVLGLLALGASGLTRGAETLRTP